MRHLSFRRFCERVGVKKTKGWDLIKRQEVAAFKIGSRTFVTRESAKEFIKRSIEKGRG